MAEQLALHQTLGKRGAVYSDERPLTARAVVMQGFGYQLLSGPRLSGDHDRGLGVGNRAHQFEDLVHLRRPAHDVLKTVLLLNLRSEKLILLHQASVIERSFDDQVEFVHRERLEQVIEGSQFHRLHGVLYRPVCGYHYHLGIREGTPGFLQNLYSVHIGQPDVGQDYVVIFVRHSLPGLLSGCSQIHPVTGAIQSLAQEVSQQGIVVNHQNPVFFHLLLLHHVFS